MEDCEDTDILAKDTDAITETELFNFTDDQENLLLAKGSMYSPPHKKLATEPTIVNESQVLNIKDSIDNDFFNTNVSKINFDYGTISSQVGIIKFQGIPPLDDIIKQSNLKSYSPKYLAEKVIRNKCQKLKNKRLSNSYKVSKNVVKKYRTSRLFPLDETHLSELNTQMSEIFKHPTVPDSLVADNDTNPNMFPKILETVHKDLQGQTLSVVKRDENIIEATSLSSDTNSDNINKLTSFRFSHYKRMLLRRKNKEDSKDISKKDSCNIKPVLNKRRGKQLKVKEMNEVDHVKIQAIPEVLKVIEKHSSTNCKVGNQMSKKLVSKAFGAHNVSSNTTSSSGDAFIEKPSSSKDQSINKSQSKFLLTTSKSETDQVSKSPEVCDSNKTLKIQRHQRNCSTIASRNSFTFPNEHSTRHTGPISYDRECIKVYSILYTVKEKWLRNTKVHEDILNKVTYKPVIIELENSKIDNGGFVSSATTTTNSYGEGSNSLDKHADISSSFHTSDEPNTRLTSSDNSASMNNPSCSQKDVDQNNHNAFPFKQTHQAQRISEISHGIGNSASPSKRCDGNVLASDTCETVPETESSDYQAFKSSQPRFNIHVNKNNAIESFSQSRTQSLFAASAISNDSKSMILQPASSVKLDKILTGYGLKHVWAKWKDGNYYPGIISPGITINVTDSAVAPKKVSNPSSSKSNAFNLTNDSGLGSSFATTNKSHYQTFKYKIEFCDGYKLKCLGKDIFILYQLTSLDTQSEPENFKLNLKPGSKVLANLNHAAEVQLYEQCIVKSCKMDHENSFTCLLQKVETGSKNIKNVQLSPVNSNELLDVIGINLMFSPQLMDLSDLPCLNSLVEDYLKATNPYTIPKSLRDNEEQVELGDNQSTTSNSPETSVPHPLTSVTKRKRNVIAMEKNDKPLSTVLEDISVQGFCSPRASRRNKKADIKSQGLSENAIQLYGPLLPAGCQIFNKIFFLVTHKPEGTQCDNAIIDRSPSKKSRILLVESGKSETSNASPPSSLSSSKILKRTQSPYRSEFSNSFSSSLDQPSHILFNRSHLALQIKSGEGNMMDTFDENIIDDNSNTVICISDTYCRTDKYLKCLSRDIPILSHIYIVDCCKKQTFLDQTSYKLPSGKSLLTHQVLLRTDIYQKFSSYKLWILIPNQNNTGADNLEEAEELCLVLAKNMGFHVKTGLNLDFTKDFKPNYVIGFSKYLSPQVKKIAKRYKTPLLNMEWLIQVLVHGETFPPDFCSKFTEF